MPREASKTGLGLLSDNGPGFVAEALQTYLKRHGIRHIRSAPYHPMTQGKIERWHRSMKNDAAG